MTWELIQPLAVALGLGLLVGFQREWTAPHVAGLRTFALISVFGALVGLLSEDAGGWLIAAGLLVAASLVIVGGAIHRDQRDKDPGLTTQSAAIVMYLVGVAVARDHVELGLIAGGGTAVLLHWKEPLHALVRRVGAAEFRAIIQLVLIALVVLPVLPNANYGPYGVFNPFEIWMMVVLIVGISLFGYISYKFFGGRAGALLAGLFGGLISSTATTVSYARRSRQEPQVAPLAAAVIMIASTVVFGRVLVEIIVVAPKIFWELAPPLAIMMGLMAVLAGGLFVFQRGDLDPNLLDESPSGLQAAILFGLLYAGVLYAVAIVKERFDDQALFLVAALSGLTDMDAITLSTAQMAKRDQLEVSTGWRMILVAAMSNLVFKGLTIALLGHRRLRVRIAVVFGAALAGGLALMRYWP